MNKFIINCAAIIISILCFSFQAQADVKPNFLLVGNYKITNAELELMKQHLIPGTKFNLATQTKMVVFCESKGFHSITECFSNVGAGVWLGDTGNCTCSGSPRLRSAGDHCVVCLDHQ